METKPMVTVIMFCYNCEKIISASIYSILSQSFLNFELIVVDDASSDFTKDQLKQVQDTRVKIIYNSKSAGKYKIYNKILKIASGKYICFIEPDYIPVSNKLSIQFDYFESHPRLGCLGGNISVVEKDGIILSGKKLPATDADLKVLLLRYNPFNLSSLIFKKSYLERHKLQFKSNLAELAFYDFMIRASSCITFHILQDILLVKRSSEENQTLHPYGESEELLKKLQIRQLRKFRTKYNKTEFTIHLKLIRGEILTSQELGAACEWLNKLLYSNNQSKSYNSRALYTFFKKLLAEQLMIPGRDFSPMTRSQLLNTLIERFNYTSYLEIGVFDPQQNFDNIRCTRKTGVDPEPLRADIINATSDEFFNGLHKNELFDLIFIDGLHHSEQVTKDIVNSLEHLNINGTIVCHDMLPENEEMQIVPCQTVRWMGDCWKSWAHFRMTNSQLSMQVVDSDCGMGIIRNGIQVLFKTNSTKHTIDYSFFKKNRNKLMNVVSVSEFLKNLENCVQYAGI